MKIKWLFIVLVCFVVGNFLLLSSGQADSRPTYKLLILDSQSGNPYDEIRLQLIQTLAQLGFKQGENLEIVLHAAGNDAQKGEQILREEVKKGFDVVFVGGTVATIAAKQALLGSKQAVVFAAPTDPVAIGVIDDFISPPKANFTGVCYPVSVKARFRFIHQLLPKAKTLGLIYAEMPQSLSYNAWVRHLVENDPEFKDIRLLFRSVPLVTGENGDQAMAKMAIPLIQELDSQVDAFIKPNDQMGTRRHFSQIIWQNATKPLIGIVKNDVMAQWGATAVVFPSHVSIGHQAAEMIGKLFHGSAISAITPQWPMQFGYAIDLAKAHHFEMSVPVGLLQLAGENIVK